jgi:hypothetical protein
MARRDGRTVRLFTRNGYNFADRFPKIVEAVANLPVRSCFIDGEAIVVDENGLSVFELPRYRLRDQAALLCAFDLIELDGNDLRRASIEDRCVIQPSSRKIAACESWRCTYDARLWHGHPGVRCIGGCKHSGLHSTRDGGVLRC